MATWENSSIEGIYIGAEPNDGTGDDIRTAFDKTDANFANISSFLASDVVNFETANLTSINSTTGNFTGTLTVNNFAVTSSASINANVTAGNLNANTGIHTSGVATFGATNATTLRTSGGITTDGGIVTSGNITPTANITYDLGSPTYFFRNIYAQGLVQVNTVSASADAGILLIHANLSPGDNQDVGILGKFDNDLGSNSYAYFGLQNTTRDFVFKITDTNVTETDNIVSDGIYGNTHFGSQYLSNATAATSTTTGALIVAGGVGVAGNLYAGNIIADHIFGTLTGTTANIVNMSLTGSVSGNLYVDNTVFANGSPLISAATLTNYGSIFTGGLISGPQVYLSTVPSTSTSTGAVVINGGLGVAGNINAGRLYGPYYGTIANGVQPNITQVGTLGNLQIGTGGTLSTPVLQATTIGVTDLTAVGNVYISNLSGLTGLNMSGNLTASAILGAIYGAQGNITAVGTLTGLTVSGNTAIDNTLYGRGVYDNGIRVVSGTVNGGNLTISNGNVSLTATGPGAVTTGSATAVPIITTDIYGRISSITTAAVSSTLNLAGTSGTGSIALTSQSLTFAGSNGITASASGQTITINSPQNLQTTASPTFAGITIPSVTKNGTTGTGDIGQTGNRFGTVYATATSALYADLAEKYLTDQEYPVGTVVCVGGDKEVTASVWGDLPIGAISENPAFTMNSDLEGGTYIALKGRVPVRVIGTIRKGQRLVASTVPGCATAGVPHSGDVFGIALESSDVIEEKLIEAVIL